MSLKLMANPLIKEGTDGLIFQYLKGGMNRDSWPRWQFVRYSFKMSCMERADISWLYQPRMVRRVCCKI